MRTILVTGGASGLGKGIAMHYLQGGDRVIAVGSSVENGEALYEEAKQVKAEQRVIYMRANLSLISENNRIIEEIQKLNTGLDAIVFCATKHSKDYIETQEGIEFTFGLDYLSRFILSYGLKEYLEKSKTPIIISVCGTGMKGEVNWRDLQHRNSFDPLKVMMHGSRLNDLAGVWFANSDEVRKIKYILYNPWAVQTSGMLGMYGPAMKMIYKIIGKSIEKAVIPISRLLNDPPKENLSAYKESKQLELSLPMYNRENAKRLYDETIKLLY